MLIPNSENIQALFWEPVFISSHDNYCIHCIPCCYFCYSGHIRLPSRPRSNFLPLKSLLKTIAHMYEFLLFHFAKVKASFFKSKLITCLSIMCAKNAKLLQNTEIFNRVFNIIGTFLTVSVSK